MKSYLYSLNLKFMNSFPWIVTELFKLSLHIRWVMMVSVSGTSGSLLTCQICVCRVIICCVLLRLSDCQLVLSVFIIGRGQGEGEWMPWLPCQSSLAQPWCGQGGGLLRASVAGSHFSRAQYPGGTVMFSVLAWSVLKSPLPFSGLVLEMVGAGWDRVCRYSLAF